MKDIKKDSPQAEIIDEENQAASDPLTKEHSAEVSEDHLLEDHPDVLNAELIALRKELAELKDANLRQIAETQNIQRRSHEEVKKARDYAISNFAKEMITIKDYLEMALKDQSGNFEMLKMGVDLTLNQLKKVFEGHHIKEINPQPNDKLDANLHQAMDIIEEHQQAPNTIVGVMQKGYILNGRVLRAAMVSVAK